MDIHAFKNKAVRLLSKVLAWGIGARQASAKGLLEAREAAQRLAEQERSARKNHGYGGGRHKPKPIHKSHTKRIARGEGSMAQHDAIVSKYGSRNAWAIHKSALHRRVPVSEVLREFEETQRRIAELRGAA